MGLSITRKDVELDKCFKEDSKQFYDLANEFINLTTEDFVRAFEISKKAWVLADRWACIAANASKLVLSSNANKTDLKDYCYRKYRSMQQIHEFTRVLWNKGEQSSKEKRL
jgi:hypothetical protein